MIRQAFFAFSGVLLLLLLGSVAHGQIETARITETISDSTGAVIPGAQVKFTHVATAQARGRKQRRRALPLATLAHRRVSARG